MKSTIVQEISEVDQPDGEKESSSNNQPALSEGDDYPKNIENYFVLLKSLYENSTLLNRIKGIHEQSCELKFESFKENIVANQADNNGNSNQRKNININIKSEPDNSTREAGGERSLGNIIINSLDVSINVARKAACDGDHHGNIDRVRILCSTTPPKYVKLPLSTPDQLVTSSSSEPDENCCSKQAITSPSTKYNNSASNNIDDGPTRAVYSSRVETTQTVPDDISSDYHRIKPCDDDDDKHTSSTTCNNNSAKYPNGEDDAGDYHTRTIDTGKNIKHNNSSGDIKPITSTYLLMTRSMGLTDEDALNLVSGLLLLLSHNFLKRILRSKNESCAADRKQTDNQLGDG